MIMTNDDERARRICSLALAFMNATAPVPSSEVARRFYPSLSPDSFRRAFSRDRALLSACGLRVCEGPRESGRGSQATWVADEGSSFAGEMELSPSEAAVLEIACQPLVDDPEFPLSGDLRFALAKLTRTFAYPSALPSGEPRGESRVATSVRDAVMRRRALQVTYTDAAGRTSERTLSPYGLFGLRGVTYLVADRVDAQTGACDDDPRTYRVDRISSSRVLEDVSVSVPEDFSPAQWRRLPFQMGEVAGTAAFLVPDGREADLRRVAGGLGHISEGVDGLVWEVEYSDARAAAAWAVAQGVVPLSPEPVVREARALLKGAADAA